MEELKPWLLSLIMFTQLSGQPLWVESTQVLVVRESLDCAHKQATTIMVSGKPFCVKETIDAVREKVKAGNQVPW